MRTAILSGILILLGGHVASQTETYDNVTYTVPAGWKKEMKENGLQLYTRNDKTGDYAAVFILKAAESKKSANENFRSEWNRLIKSTVQVPDEPTMEAPEKDNGWEITTGRATYTDGTQKGMALLVTATGGDQLISMVVMSNTVKYQEGLMAFINSLQLSPAPTGSVANSHTSPTGENGNALHAKIPGKWSHYMLETNGYLNNGQPIYTGGHFRKEYRFNEDGSYKFIHTSVSTKMTYLLLTYESGTWSASGNELTLKPLKGKTETWSKQGHKLKWGKLLTSEDRELETVVYKYQFTDITNDSYLVLQYPGETKRDGPHNHHPNFPNAWMYKHLYQNKSAIVLPSGKNID